MPQGQEMMIDSVMPSDQMMGIEQENFAQMPASSTDRFYDFIGQTDFMLDDIIDEGKCAYEDCEMINENLSQTDFQFEDLQDLTSVELETK